MSLRWLVINYRRFRGACCLHLHNSPKSVFLLLDYPEGRSCRLLRNVAKQPLTNKASYTWRLYSCKTDVRDYNGSLVWDVYCLESLYFFRYVIPFYAWVWKIFWFSPDSVDMYSRICSVRQAVLPFLRMSWRTRMVERVSSLTRFRLCNCLTAIDHTASQKLCVVDEHSNSVTLLFISISRRYWLCLMMDYNADRSQFYLLRPDFNIPSSWLWNQPLMFF
jgi:hypothetical protein